MKEYIGKITGKKRNKYRISFEDGETWLVPQQDISRYFIPDSPANPVPANLECDQPESMVVLALSNSNGLPESSSVDHKSEESEDDTGLNPANDQWNGNDMSPGSPRSKKSSSSKAQPVSDASALAIPPAPVWQNGVPTATSSSLESAHRRKNQLNESLERNAWPRQLRKRGIEEVDQPEWGTYGRIGWYMDGGALSREDEDWWRLNKPRRGGGTGKAPSQFGGKFCEVCGQGGVLVECDGPRPAAGRCADGAVRAFHLICLPRPLLQPPEGPWACDRCRAEQGRTVEARVVPDAATRYVCDVLEISAFDGLTEFSRPDLPDVPDDYRLGVIVGPSGSGKSMLLRAMSDVHGGAPLLSLCPPPLSHPHSFFLLCSQSR